MNMKSCTHCMVMASMLVVCASLGSQEPRSKDPARQDANRQDPSKSDPRKQGMGTGQDQARTNQGDGTDARAARGVETLLKPTEIVGRTIVDPEGKRLGEIKNFAVCPDSGRIAYAIVATGSGEREGNTKTIAVPWSALRITDGAGTGNQPGAAPGGSTGVTTTTNQFVLSMNSDRLQRAPKFDEKDWSSLSNKATATELHIFYGVQPYWEAGAKGMGHDGKAHEPSGGTGTGREQGNGHEQESGGEPESGHKQGTGREQGAAGKGR